MVHYEIQIFVGHKWHKSAIRYADPESAFADKEAIEAGGDRAQVVQVLEKRTVIEKLSMVVTE